MAYTLVKINIRELKEDVAIGVHEYDLPKGMVPVEVEDFFPQPDNTEPGVDQWSYFPRENKLKLNNTSVQDIYVKYSLLVSNYENAYFAALDPTNEVDPKYRWMPYLDKNPQVSETGKNLLEGIISYNSLNISLAAGSQNGIKEFFSSKFSVMNQDFVLWRITNTGSIRKLYTGIGNGVSSFKTKITYEAKPKIKLLDEPALYNMDISNPWSTIGERDQIPILCASILPYTVGYANAPDNPNGSSYNSGQLSWQSFNKSSLVKVKGIWGNTTFRLWPGITFNDFDLNDFSVGAKADNHNALGSDGSTPFEVENITNMTVLGEMNSSGASYPSAWSKARHPLDSVTFSDGRQIVYKDTRRWTPPTEDTVPFYTNFVFTGQNYNAANTNADPRFKFLFTTTDVYKNYLVNPGLAAGTSSTCENYPRVVPPGLQSSVTEWKSLFGVQTEARLSEIFYSYTSLGGFFHDIDNEDAGDNNAFELFLQWQIPVGHASLSMQNFLDSTLKVAFEGVTADFSELDFDESMQMVEKTDQSYRQLLEKLLPGIGYFITYDHDTEVPKMVKIDPTKAVVDTLTEDDFDAYQCRLNNQDTYYRVNLRNESMMQGENTRDDYSGYGYNQIYVSSNKLNVTQKEKIIPMLTMESSRGAEIAGWHTDNKYIYKWSCPAEDRFLDLKLGDMIYLESDLIIEPEGKAKILITQRTIDEDKISFQGIKFASIN